MKFFIPGVILASLLILGSCTGSPGTRSVVVGGFSDQEVTSPEEIQAVQKSLELLREAAPQWSTANLKKVLKFETQVVAGLNYRTTMVLTMENQEITVMTLVYKNLQNQWSLTEYKKL